jgi:hypothetical protein
MWGAGELLFRCSIQKLLLCNLFGVIIVNSVASNTDTVLLIANHNKMEATTRALHKTRQPEANPFSRTNIHFTRASSCPSSILSAQAATHSIVT